MKISDSLEKIEAARLVSRTPNRWQVQLGILRMAHRVLFRSETVGTSSAPVRSTLRARLFAWRAARLPGLLWERAVVPFDLSGLGTHPDRLVAHLLAAHHDGRQFAYDLQILSVWPGRLEEVHRRAAEVAAGDDRRSRWLRDLVVFEGYHVGLRDAALEAMERDWGLTASEAADPDISLLAWLDWCAARPETPAATWAAWRRGELEIAGVTRRRDVCAATT